MGKDAYLYQIYNYITKMVFPTELTHNQQTKPLYIGLDGGASSGVYKQGIKHVLSSALGLNSLLNGRIFQNPNLNPSPAALHPTKSGFTHLGMGQNPGT